MASGPGAHLIFVVKYEKYALRGVLDFGGVGHILYENMYHAPSGGVSDYTQRGNRLMWCERRSKTGFLKCI